MDALLADLSSFDAAARTRALKEIAAAVKAGRIEREPVTKPWMNLHLHTFHSFNCNDWSPSRVVFEAWRIGLRYAGTVDFDTLAALAETRAAGAALGVPTVGGFESRVFLPEMKDAVINSPKEPGIYYLCGKGFPAPPKPGTPEGAFFAGMQETAQSRNRGVIERLNAFLGEVRLDYGRDVLPLTPSGNPTERHIVAAYHRVSEKTLGGRVDAFWSGVLGLPETETRALRTGRPADFQERLRTRLIKFGGPGYAAPDPAAFPRFDDVVRMTKAAGGRAVGTWLDGTSDGERDPERFLALLRSKGIDAMEIIPDRNWRIADPAEKARKVANLDAFMAACARMGMPVVCGTEMNKTGQPFVDDFTQPEISRHLPYFLESARLFF